MTALWHPYRGSRVSLVADADGSYSPRIVRVTLHRAGMLVERQIEVPRNVQRARYSSRDEAAASALDALGLLESIAI